MICLPFPAWPWPETGDHGNQNEKPKPRKVAAKQA